MTYSDVFELFVDKGIIQLLVDESRRYSLFCIQPNPNILPTQQNM